jgi:RNA polymerase sigma-70 factor (ECF subfamily)
MADKTANQKQISDPEKWVELHGDYLFRYAMMRLNNQSLAEDVVQETFLAALKARKNFAGQSSERTWFVGILKRKVIDHFRKFSREDSHDDIQKIIDMQDDDFLLSGSRRGQWKTGRRPKDWMIDENDQSEKNEFWEFLKRCIAELPRRLAEVFILREMEEIETDELSNVVELKPTNLRVILYRARKQLRSCLEDNWIRSHEDRK